MDDAKLAAPTDGDLASGRKRPRDSPPPTHAGVEVLASASVWAAVAPELKTRAAELVLVANGDDGERLPKYQVDRFQPDKYPRPRGFLAHVAVLEDDRRTLELLALAQRAVADNGDAPKLRLSGVLQCALAGGRFELLRWLVDTLPTLDATWEWEGDIMRVALKSCGHAGSAETVELLEWLHASCPRESVVLSAREVANAVGLARLPVVQWLHARDAEYAFSAKAMDAAAANGSLEVVEFLHEKRSEGCTADALDSAAANGHLDVVRFLHEKRDEGCTARAMDNAAKNGHLDVVRFLHENRQEGCSARAMDGAAGGGHLAVVQFLHSHRTEGCTARAMDEAADRGHLDVLHFLQEHCSEGFSSTRTLKWSAKNAHLDMLQFLHAHLPASGWSEAAMDAAAAAGRLDAVQFLHEHRTEGCTTRAMDNAAKFGHLEVVRFLHEHRTEGCSVVALMQSIENGHDDVVKFLYMHRYKDNAPRSL
ncbi:hypothetical protein PybrP1_008278 [[Pythium] brassicae (nom. inval.)]|nr:hypothetical protein PybrP1_008278 [[Pythium] brassicae (nom. inval.)]